MNELQAAWPANQPTCPLFPYFYSLAGAKFTERDRTTDERRKLHVRHIVLFLGTLFQDLYKGTRGHSIAL